MKDENEIAKNIMRLAWKRTEARINSDGWRLELPRILSALFQLLAHPAVQNEIWDEVKE